MSAGTQEERRPPMTAAEIRARADELAERAERICRESGDDGWAEMFRLLREMP